MTVEWQVTRIERAVAAQQRRDAFVDWARQWARHVPIHSVMHDQEIHAGLRRFLKRHQARIDRRADFRDSAIVRDLEPVKCPWRVFERGATRAVIAIGDEVVEVGHGASWFFLFLLYFSLCSSGPYLSS